MQLKYVHEVCISHSFDHQQFENHQRAIAVTFTKYVDKYVFY